MKTVRNGRTATFWLIVTVILSVLTSTGFAIKCHQCSSDQEENGNDICGAYEPFNKEQNFPVECLGEEAVTPGTFCVRIVKQGPRGFIWDGRWRSVTRRCASVSESGLNWGCNWGIEENGVYWEECYCNEDGCNGATSSKIQSLLFSLALSSIVIIFNHFT